MKLKEGNKYKNPISNVVYTLYKTENNKWYLHPSPEDLKRGYIIGEECTREEMEKLINKRLERI